MNPFSFIATVWQKLIFGEGGRSKVDDGQSVLSKSNSRSGASKHDRAPPAAPKPVIMGASSTSFAQAAQQNGWGAPTATQPSLGA